MVAHDSWPGIDVSICISDGNLLESLEGYSRRHLYGMSEVPAGRPEAPEGSILSDPTLEETLYHGMPDEDIHLALQGTLNHDSNSNESTARSSIGGAESTHGASHTPETASSNSQPDSGGVIVAQELTESEPLPPPQEQKPEVEPEDVKVKSEERRAQSSANTNRGCQSSGGFSSTVDVKDVQEIESMSSAWNTADPFADMTVEEIEEENRLLEEGLARADELERNRLLKEKLAACKKTKPQTAVKPELAATGGVKRERSDESGYGANVGSGRADKRPKQETGETVHLTDTKFDFDHDED